MRSSGRFSTVIEAKNIKTLNSFSVFAARLMSFENLVPDLDDLDKNT